MQGTDMAFGKMMELGLADRLDQLPIEWSTERVQIEGCSGYDMNEVPGAKWFSPIRISCERLAETVERTIDKGQIPIIIGGDHSIVMGSVAGAKAALHDKRIGILYIDAHGDFNTNETTTSGNIHGESLSAACGIGHPGLANLYIEGAKVLPEDVYIIGARSIDKEERMLMKEKGVNVYTASRIAEEGFSVVFQKVLDSLMRTCDCVHLSFDIDSVDPSYAPGTGLCVPAGFSSREAVYMLDRLYASGMICSADFVEYNPGKDIYDQTGNLIITLIAHLLGETYY